MAMFGDLPGVRKQPFSPLLGASGWQSMELAVGWRDFFICGPEEEGAVVMQQMDGRSLCWASVCPHACLFVSLKEAGAGPAAAWAEQLLCGTQLLSLVTESPPHFSSTLTVQVVHWASLF